MNNKDIKKVHFMGIGGSALSGVSVIAKKQGLEVSGCDLEENTAYTDLVRSEGIDIYNEHNKKHLKGKDLLVASPSVMFVSEKHPEVQEAKKKGIFLTWPKFLGLHLQKGKRVICIAGTHGKSTTTSLASLIFEKAGLDPSAVVGAKVNEWRANFRFGKGDFFIVEADEFFDSFLNYSPETIILNNIEFDHPDYFESESEMLDSYVSFIKLLKSPKNLIVNLDSKGNKDLLERIKPEILKSLNIYGYTLGTPYFELEDKLVGKIITKDREKIKFEVGGFIRGNFTLDLLGDYNVSNALGVVILSKIYGINADVVQKTFASFGGTGRRLEKLGEKKGILIYDDYAHHPTAIKATISALRQKHPKNRIWSIIEAHGYSRTKALLKDYKGAFDNSDKVIIGSIFKARDKQKFGVNGYSIVKASGHNDIKFVPAPAQIISKLKREARKDDVILVMGAGYSYKWARDILKSI